MVEGEITGIVLLSLKVAAVSMVFAVPMAFAIAYVLGRFEFYGKGLLQALVTLPLVMPPVVTGYLLLVAFGPNGPLGRLFGAFGVDFAFHWEGAALAAGVMAFPLLVRPMRLAVEAMDRGLEEAAATLGASGLTRFVTITLPLVLPGVIAGAVLGFAKALGEFGATITFVSNIPGETQTLSLAIYSLLQSPAGDRAAMMLIGVSAFLAIGSVLLSEWIGRRIDFRARS
ncbi:MAG: molybdate ABC transporter permease subunit [Pseudomonadota bacterium]